MKSKDNMGYREYLLSDENIYLSIYSLNSYVFEYDLLDANDRELYHSLQDKFDKKVINKVILKVRKRIEELLNKDEEFIEVKVYFKPKKMSKDGLEFRPLHTTDLITQIAIVAMLHLFVYEIPEKKDYKLLLSNLSRLIPSDFYGNRVSTKPECLFKSWKKQYQKYNQNSNDGELRILSFLRNPLFNIEEFQKREILLDNGQNEHTVDYSIMRVIEIFYSFVKEPVRIDNLIVTHKYICDVWKNGSKHLYFYTLHNQEHAIVLIQNIVKLINTIDFLKISSIDYYILFLACYLHDISMVKIPACDSFLLDTDKADELAKTLLDSYNEEFNKANLTKNVQGNDIDILSVKKYMLDSYRKIDNYFEEAVRSKHANDSAAEIRKRSELNYLDTSMRELVAEVSEAHGADERDIYGIKSVASKQLISIKFDKILLRLADLLDMSSYRVSKPILYHNVEQMSEESAFHWISHLLTKGYSLRTEYEITDNAHVLAPKNIIEKLVLEIPVNISQMSALTCGRTCKKVGIDRNRLSQQGIVLVCGQECKDNGNQERNCNFLCKWFCVKNENLIKELAALKEYLNRNKNNYFKSAIEIRIKCNDRTSLDARQFEILNEYIGKM